MKRAVIDFCICLRKNQEEMYILMREAYNKYTIQPILETVVNFVVSKTYWCGLELTLDVKSCEA